MSPHRGILLVEDEEAISDALRRMLERAGYTVRVAIDGKQALVALGEALPEVLILDLVLPRVGGFAVLEHMHQHHMTLPVIVITANPLYDDPVRYTSIVQVLIKPFPIEELLAALRTIIDLLDPF